MTRSPRGTKITEFLSLMERFFSVTSVSPWRGAPASGSARNVVSLSVMGMHTQGPSPATHAARISPSASRAIAILVASLAGSCAIDFDAPFSDSPGGPVDASAEPSAGAGGAAFDAAPDKSDLDAAGGVAGSAGEADAGGAAGSGNTGGTVGLDAAAGQAGTAGQAAGGGSAGSSGSSGSAGAQCVPVGHDEDQDSVDDACDDCPSISNLDQSNADGDGIGDVCEAPGAPSLVTHVAYFEPFLANTFPDWTPGQYVMGGDEAKVDSNVCDPYCGKNAVWNTVVSGAYSAEVTFRFEVDSDMYGCVLFALESAGNPEGKWWSCCLRRGQGQDPSIGLWYYPGTGSVVNSMKEANGVENPSAVPATVRRIRADYAPNQPIVCTYDNAVGDHAQVQYQPSYWAASSKAGLRAYQGEAHFSSFVLYQ